MTIEASAPRRKLSAILMIDVAYRFNDRGESALIRLVRRLIDGAMCLA